MTDDEALLVDVDEVLGDFQTPTLEIMATVTGRRNRPEDFDVWDIFSVLNEEQKKICFAMFERHGFCASLKPYPEAIEGIRELRSLIHVVAVTSQQHSRNWTYERTEWLIEHFGFAAKDVHYTSEKFRVDGVGILDDNPSHVERWAKKHPEGAAMLWHIPNTRNLGQGLTRVKTWAEVISIMKARRP
jgi:5'(3')-deoxyribonucleotidase